MKYYGTNVFISGYLLDRLKSVGYKGSRNQFRIVCKAKSMAAANRLCESYGLGSKAFESLYTAQTGNNTEIVMCNIHTLIIHIGYDKYIGIEELLNGKQEVKFIYETDYNGSRYSFEEVGTYIKVYVNGEAWGVPQGERFIKALIEDIKKYKLK